MSPELEKLKRAFETRMTRRTCGEDRARLEDARRQATTRDLELRLKVLTVPRPGPLREP